MLLILLLPLLLSCSALLFMLQSFCCAPLPLHVCLFAAALAHCSTLTFLCLFASSRLDFFTFDPRFLFNTLHILNLLKNVCTPLVVYLSILRDHVVQRG